METWHLGYCSTLNTNWCWQYKSYWQRIEDVYELIVYVCNIDGAFKYCFYVWKVANKICTNIMSFTQEIFFDLDEGFAGGSQTVRYLWTVTDVLHLKIHWGWIAVVSCALELILLSGIKFYVVLYLVRAVYKVWV